MSFSQELGTKIKAMRLNAKLTLTECSELTGLSAGFLSQIENGKTSISIDNLQAIARCLDVELNYFFNGEETNQNIVISRTWSRKPKEVLENVLLTELNDGHSDLNIYPVILTVGSETRWDGQMHYYDGDVFFYVIDGILTLRTGEDTVQLFPDDAAHFPGEVGYACWNESPFAAHVFFARKNKESGEKEGETVL